MIIPHSGDIFYIVGEIPFPEIQKTFHGEEPKRGKILCPFHSEKTPSFHIYSDGFKCFSCGEYGDSVDFVAKLYNLRPLEAARLIAEKFGISTDQGDHPPRPSREVLKARKKKELDRALAEYEAEAFRRLMTLIDTTREKLKSLELDPLTVDRVHNLPLLEFWADILTEGTERQKADLLKDEYFRGWIDGL